MKRISLKPARSSNDRLMLVASAIAALFFIRIASFIMMAMCSSGRVPVGRARVGRMKCSVCSLSPAALQLCGVLAARQALTQSSTCGTAPLNNLSSDNDSWSFNLTGSSGNIQARCAILWASVALCCASASD